MKLLGLIIAILSLTLLGSIFLYNVDAQACDMYDHCGSSGCATNECPQTSDRSSDNMYYEGSSCVQVICDASKECDPTYQCNNITYQWSFGSCTGWEESCVFVNAICAYSAGFHHGTQYGWWIPGNMDEEGTGSTIQGSLASQCYDGHDNDCDGKCDEYGCLGIGDPDEGENSCDLTAPITSVSSLTGTSGSNGWYISDVDIKLDCDDEGRSGCPSSGVPPTFSSPPTDISSDRISFAALDETYYCIDQTNSCTPTNNYGGGAATIQVVNDGNNFVRYYSNDNAGNSEIVKVTQVPTDESPPVTTVQINSGTLGSGGWYTTNVDAEIVCDDPHSGCDTIRWCLDTVDTCTPILTYPPGTPLPFASDGVSYIRYYSTNNAGLEETVKSTTIMIDKTPPTITDDYGARNGVWVTGDQLVTFDPQDVTSGINMNMMYYCLGAGCDPLSGNIIFSPYEITHSTSDILDTWIRYGTDDVAGWSSSIGEYHVMIDNTASSTIIDSPAAGSWHGGRQHPFDVTITDTGADKCFYMVESNSVITVPWTERTCGEPSSMIVSITTGPGNDSRNLGANTAEVFSRAQSSAGVNSTVSRTFSLDWDPASYVSYSNSNCDHTVGNICWVTQGTVVTHTITHTDSLSGPLQQYFSLTKDGCPPLGCPAGEEIKSYVNVDTDAFTDWAPYINDNYFDITGADPCGGNCNGQVDAVVDWPVTTGNTEGNFEIWTYMYDEEWNNQPSGYDNTGWEVRIDNTDPTGSVMINSGDTHTASEHVTLTLNSADIRSGIPTNGCKYWDSDGSEPVSWEPCDFSKAWTFQINQPVEVKTMYQKVTDNVGRTVTLSDTITLDVSIPSSTIISPENSSWERIIGFFISVVDVDVDYCEYMVESNGNVTRPWTGRNCNAIQAITSNVGGDCDTEGLVCNVSVRGQNTGTGQWSDIDSKMYGLDWIGPSKCVIEPNNGLPQWSHYPFFLNWTANDNWGIKHYLVELDFGSGWMVINDTGSAYDCEFEDGDPQNGSVCSLQNGVTYDFKCIAYDKAGNVGEWGFNTTTIDSFSPSILIELGERWIANHSQYWSGNEAGGEYSFIINWSSTDDVSGRDCYYLQWYNGTGWDYFNYTQFNRTECMTNESIVFGPHIPVTVDEGVKYQFRIQAKDFAGHVSPWNYFNSTIDLQLPEVDVSAVFMGIGIDVRSNTSDNISGIEFHDLSWVAATSSNSKTCSATEPFAVGTSSYCTDMVTGESAVDVTVNVSDRAGNNMLKQMYFGKVVSFDVHELNLVLGSTYLLKVNVLNPEPTVDNITLTIFGNYPPAFTRFKDFGSGNFEIYPGGLSMTAYDMAPGEKRNYFVEIVSSDVYSTPKVLEVRGQLETAGTMNSDFISILVTYPVSFSGLTDVAVAILILVAVAGYYFKRK